jgi:flagellar biosynthesis/type III secretory pathway protein FliH
VAKEARFLSRIIKHSVPENDISIGPQPSVRDFIPQQLTPKKNSPQVALDFNRCINDSISSWCDKVNTRVQQERLNEVFESGYDKGYREAIESEHSQRDAYIDEHFGRQFGIIESLLAESRKKQDQSFKNLERKVVELSVAIAETIISRSVETDASIIEGVVHDAMSYIIGSEKLILRVSSHDYETINARYDRWFDMAGNAKEFRIEIDKRLGPGDCLIETEGGIVDATVKSRLGAVSGALLRVSGL